MADQDLTSKPGLAGALLHRAAASLPSPLEAGAGAVAWSLLMGATGYLAVWRLAWQIDAKLAEVGILFAAGGLVAFPIALFAARLVAGGRRAEIRYASAFLALALATVAATALAYALHYRLYYAHWHAPAFSITWTFQLVFTTAAAVYQFLVTGLRLFFPVGFVILLAASLWLARRTR